MSKTLYDKIFFDHVIKDLGDDTYLIGIDRHLMHEVTSPQAFFAMEKAGRKPFDKGELLLTEDHNIPTKGGYEAITNANSKDQVDTLRANVKKHNLNFFPMGDERQGIVHVVAPEQGFILPGMTMICGDSHTATHGALGAIAFGVGTSEVSHALQTGSLKVKKLKNMRITINGKLKKYVTAKDVILYIIGEIGTSGGTGYAIEFYGEVFDTMSIEERMTVCNMAIEAGAKVGLIEPDQKLSDYFYDKPMAPKGEDFKEFNRYITLGLYTDIDADFDLEYEFYASDIEPQVTWGTNPEEVTSIDGTISFAGRNNDHATSALKYMGLEENQEVSDIFITQVFIGSCTNGRIEDLRQVAMVIEKTGLKKHENVKRVLVVPGSGLVKKQAEEEGLDKIFIEAGFQWRDPGCSACLGMNDDTMPYGEHVASTSNRNFVDRQGNGARTHLCSPIVATLAALYGRFVNPTEKLMEV